MALGPPVHPLDSSISTIAQNKELLTEGQIAIIRSLLPKDTHSPRKPPSGDSEVQSHLETLVRMMDRLTLQAGATEDIGELRQSMAAIERVISLITKLQDQVDTDRRFRLLQESIVEALDPLPIEAKEAFFRLWEIKISASER